MKKNKIFGIAIASLGVVFSMATAAALYVKGASNTYFNIGAGDYHGSDGTVTYKINGNTSGTLNPSYLKEDGTNGGSGLSAEYTQVKYEAVLSADYASDLSAQDVVVGNLEVKITNINSDYQGKLKIWAGIDGYAEYGEGSVKTPSWGKYLYESRLMRSDEDDPDTASDFVVDAEHSEFVVNRNIAVKADGSQKLVIYLKYELAENDYLMGNEAALGYKLDVTWGAATSSFKPAFVVGDGNQWTQDDEFAMAPDIDRTTHEDNHDVGFQWIYSRLKGTLGNAKCNSHEAWSGGDNTPLDAAKIYNVYWSGVNGEQAYFTPIV